MPDEWKPPDYAKKVWEPPQWAKPVTEEKPTEESGIFAPVNNFILKRLHQLSGEEPGILNPDPSLNPVINKPVLPEATHTSDEGYIPWAAKGIYNNVVRPMTSPLGILGTFMGASPAEYEPIRLPEAPPRPPLAIPEVIAQPRYELPPAPSEIANPPRFIGGAAGVAENKYYPMDVGPINPHLGAVDEGTVLSRELEGMSQVPPEYAATRGLGFGRPETHMRTPAEAAQEALIPDRYKNPNQLVPEPSTPAEFNIGDPNAEYQLPSATAKPAISELRNIPEELHEANKVAHPLGDAPPIDVVMKEVAPESTPTPGAPKDINNIVAYTGSADQVLESRPATAGIVKLVRNQGWDKTQSAIGTEIRVAGNISEGMNEQQLFSFGKAVENVADENDKAIIAQIPGIEDKLKQARALFDSIYGEAKIARSGKMGYIEDYFPHVEKMPEDMLAGIKEIFNYTQGKAAMKAMFERKPLVGEGTGEAAGIYNKGVGQVSESPFTKPRGTAIKELDYNFNKIARLYIESMARERYLRPAVEKAKTIIEELPDSKLKNLAEMWIKNITRFDSAPELHKANQQLARFMIDATGKSMMGWNPHLQALHLMRLGPVWVDLGTEYSAKGLASLLKNPRAAYEEAASLGLLPQELYPPKFQTPTERANSILNFKSQVDFIDRSIAFKGFEKKFLDQGMAPELAREEAIVAAKKSTFTVDPARATMGLNPDYSALGTVGRLMAQYKAVPAKIVEWTARTAAGYKKNPAAAKRALILLGSAGGSAAVGGPELFHMPTSLEDWSGASINEMKKILTFIYKGDPESALEETMLWMTPAGKSIQRLFQ